MTERGQERSGRRGDAAEPAAVPAADPVALLHEMGIRARAAARAMAAAPTAAKAAALRAAAALLRARSDEVLAANAEDIAAASGLSPAMLDRLRLDAGRLEAVARGLDEIAALPDPVGQVIDRRERPNGLKLARIRVPLGVVGIIYESRPNVTADAGALAAMAGNAVILRGGSEAPASNRAIHRCLTDGLLAAGLPTDAIQLVPTTDRAAVGAMLGTAGLLDVVIPRGGKGLVARVQAEARVPVLAHLDGNNHLFVHAAADPGQAVPLLLDAKLRRPGVCGAAETLLIDRAFPAGAALLAALADRGCEIRGTAEVRAMEPRAVAASAADWDTEYLLPIIAARLVDGVEDAMAHIAVHGSGHTDAIVTEDEGVAERFLATVDSAIVLWNASTQFADGGEFGLGGEIGIATGRLHARGPVALEGLTTYKWQGRGQGQVRG